MRPAMRLHMATLAFVRAHEPLCIPPFLDQEREPAVALYIQQHTPAKAICTNKWGNVVLRLLDTLCHSLNQEWEPLAEVALPGCERQALGFDEGGGGGGASPSGRAPSVAQARLSWRGDGKFLASVCSRAPAPHAASSEASAPEPNGAGAIRGGGSGSSASGGGGGGADYRIHVWDRATFELHASGEAAEGLLPLLAWQPNGRHLYVAASGAGAVSGSDSRAAARGASPQQQHQHAVLLFERNGLRHGGFGLPGAGEAGGWAGGRAGGGGGVGGGGLGLPLGATGGGCPPHAPLARLPHGHGCGFDGMLQPGLATLPHSGAHDVTWQISGLSRKHPACLPAA